MNSDLMEHLRSEMIRTAVERGCLTHPDVIAISERLDAYLVHIQKQSANEMKSHTFPKVYSGTATPRTAASL